MEGIEREVKRERSLPVQSRVNIVKLAELDRYFAESGYSVKTMSQLVSWSIDLLVEVLEANNALPTKFEDLVEAHRYLNMRGLYQPSMMKLAAKKLGTSLSFESMRKERVDPRTYANRQFKTLHNRNGVEAFNSEVKTGKEEKEMHYKDDVEKALKRAAEEDEKDKSEELEKAKEAYREQGKLATSGLREGMSQEELDQYDVDREKKVIAKENAPVDVEEMKRLGQVR